jgi:hypothetical protein
MLAILLVLGAGLATAEMSFAGEPSACTLIQGRWICAWDEPGAVRGKFFGTQSKGKFSRPASMLNR